VSQTIQEEYTSSCESLTGKTRAGSTCSESSAKQEGHNQGGIRFKDHVFENKTIHLPVYCAYDSEIIWGWGKKGLICKVCDLAVHRKCCRLTPTSCPGRRLHGNRPDISGPQLDTLVHVTGFVTVDGGKMQKIDNSHLLDPVLYKLFKSAGVDPSNLGAGSIDYAKKFAQEQKLYEYYEAHVPEEKKEKHRRRATLMTTPGAPPPPPPPPPPLPPSSSIPQVTLIKSKPKDQSNSRKSSLSSPDFLKQIEQGVKLRPVNPDDFLLRSSNRPNSLTEMLSVALNNFRDRVAESSEEEDSDWEDGNTNIELQTQTKVESSETEVVVVNDNKTEVIDIDGNVEMGVETIKENSTVDIESTETEESVCDPENTGAVIEAKSYAESEDKGTSDDNLNTVRENKYTNGEVAMEDIKKEDKTEIIKKDNSENISETKENVISEDHMTQALI